MVFPLSRIMVQSRPSHHSSQARYQRSYHEPSESALFCTCVFEHGFDPSEVTHPQKKTGTYVWPHFEYIQICILRSLRSLAHARWVDGRTIKIKIGLPWEQHLRLSFKTNFPRRVGAFTAHVLLRRRWCCPHRWWRPFRLTAAMTAMMLPSSSMETLSVDGCDGLVDGSVGCDELRWSPTHAMCFATHAMRFATVGFVDGSDVIADACDGIAGALLTWPWCFGSDTLAEMALARDALADMAGFGRVRRLVRNGPGRRCFGRHGWLWTRPSACQKWHWPEMLWPTWLALDAWWS